MANTKSRPNVGGAVRKGPTVGPDYPNENYRNPWNGGDIDKQYGEEQNAGFEGENLLERVEANSTRTLYSPTSTVAGMHVLGLNGLTDYDSNWEHGVRGGIEEKPKGPREGTRWTPRGGGKRG
jgi:hypothetical protein